MLAKLTAIQAEAQALLRQYGLTEQGWTFKYSNTKRRIADCHHSTMTIRFSLNYAQNGSPEDITDMLLHEIAHALVGRGHGHDRVWREKARELGAKPKRCGTIETTAQYNYTLYCRNCGKTWFRHRLRFQNPICPADKTELEIYDHRETPTR